MPKYGCINVHASLLPHLRGASPIQTAILEGDSETGVTIQQMGEGLDTGDIISARSIPIEPSDTGGSLFDKLARLGAELTVETIADIEEGRASATPQDESMASYAKKIDKQMGHIDYSLSAAEIERMIRALNPWPSAFSHIDGKLMKIWKASVGGSTDGKAGCVTEVKKDSFTVACGEGSLIVEEVQLEGKKRMTVHDLLLGYRINPGTVLS
jgi:methionyl-tRNA formyltransferase